MSIMDDIYQERIDQDRQWGLQNHHPLTWMSILVEEVGEAAAIANESIITKKLDGASLRRELIQVAAVAVCIIECLERGKWKKEA